MSLGHRGPIGRKRLAVFCIDRMFHFPKEGMANKQACNCKVCGDRVPKGEATETFIGDARYFLCAADAGAVRIAKTRAAEPLTEPEPGALDV